MTCPVFEVGRDSDALKVPFETLTVLKVPFETLTVLKVPFRALPGPVDVGGHGPS
jgi:hypothetical protein